METPSIVFDVDPLLPDGREMAALPPPAEGEPFLGMEFDSPETARLFYVAYADRLGFRVRNSKSFTSRVDDSVIMRRFVCSRQGRPTRKDPFDLTKKRRNRASTREGCRAMFQVNRRPEGGTWTVSRCVVEHCHPLGVHPKPSPGLQKKLDKKPWELLAGTDTNTPSNGLGPGGGVAQSLLEYFKRMQADNPAFFYAIQLDSNNCVANMFWASARSIMSFSYFGDTATLDTSCRRNKRVMPPFVAFTGVNHHRQLVVFGCGFMTDESEASFTWLFETWLTVMNGRSPVSLVTPYDDPVAGAAERVFPNVRLRFCKMDIFNKSKDKLSDVYAAHPLLFKSEFKKCVNECDHIVEFEATWRLLIGRYYLEDNMWLRFLYDIRQKWVPAYFRGTFFADFSAPKMETMHKFFQRHSITTTTLRDLVTQFDKAMAGQYEKEVQADFASIHTRPVLKTPSPMEKQASEVYTKTIFELFQEELVESPGLVTDKLEDGVVSKFHVVAVENVGKPCTCIVTYNASEKRISCSCGMFEFSGILCRHVFRVLLVVGITTLPEGYILRRWTRNAKSNVLSAVNQCSSRKALNRRCHDLCRDAIRFAEEGATSAVIYKVAKGALQKAFDEIYAVKKGPLFKGPGGIIAINYALDILENHSCTWSNYAGHCIFAIRILSSL